MKEKKQGQNKKTKNIEAKNWKEGQKTGTVWKGLSAILALQQDALPISH